MTIIKTAVEEMLSSALGEWAMPGACSALKPYRGLLCCLEARGSGASVGLCEHREGSCAEGCFLGLTRELSADSHPRHVRSLVMM